MKTFLLIASILVLFSCKKETAGPTPIKDIDATGSATFKMNGTEVSGRMWDVSIDFINGGYYLNFSGSSFERLFDRPKYAFLSSVRMPSNAVTSGTYISSDYNNFMQILRVEPTGSYSHWNTLPAVKMTFIITNTTTDKISFTCKFNGVISDTFGKLITIENGQLTCKKS